MIANIVDNRTNKYSCENLDVFFEPSCEDNSMAGATQFDPDDPKIYINCESIHVVSVAEAIEFGNGYDFPVTMFLYEHDAELGKSVRDANGKVDRTKLCFRNWD